MLKIRLLIETEFLTTNNSNYRTNKIKNPYETNC